MVQLTIHGNTVNLSAGNDGHTWSSLNDESNRSGYILLLTKSPLNKDQTSDLIKDGVVIQEYVGEDTYLCHYPLDDIKSIALKPYVKEALPYVQDFKVEGTLQTSARLSKAKIDVRVVLHDHRIATSLDVANELSEKAGVPLDSITVDKNSVEMVVSPDQLSALVMSDSVKVVEQVVPKELNNDIARTILGFDSIASHLDSEWPAVGDLQGEGQVVAVADTGLDTGNIENVHPAFTGRVKALVPIGDKTTADDPSGHGTHVCGSLLGAEVASSKLKIKGAAPKASLVMQSMGVMVPQSGKVGISVPKGDKLTELFTAPYKEHGARIHSNSWGDRWNSEQRGYSDEATLIDQCVCDNPDLLICIAAGNNGIQSSHATLGGPPAARNCLTIGATESTRPSTEGRLHEGGLSQNDPTEIPWYSDRGPTKDGRIKPDVVAPGSTILSAKTRHPRFKSFGFGDCPDPLWTYNTGTSMSTPLVAGCAAVLREYLNKIGIPSPKAALLKALLINGSYAYHHAHHGREGFGRVNIRNSLIPKDGPQAGFTIDEKFDDIDQKRTIKVTIDESGGQVTAMDFSKLRVSPPAASGVTLKVTMAYTDLPGPVLQNNLNLLVIAADGTERHGNMGTSNRFDNYNNVEQIVWKGIPSGVTEITVIARRLLPKRQEQDFAIAWKIIPNEE